MSVAAMLVEVPLAHEVAQVVEHVVDRARQAKEVLAVDGRAGTPASLADELVAQRVAAVLDLGHVLVRLGRVGSALRHRARQPAGGDGLGELPLEDRDQRVPPSRVPRVARPPCETALSSHAHPPCRRRHRAGGRRRKRREPSTHAQGDPRPLRVAVCQSSEVASRQVWSRALGAPTAHGSPRATASPVQPDQGDAGHGHQAAAQLEPVGRSPSQKKAMTTASGGIRQSAYHERGRRPGERVDPGQVGHDAGNDRQVDHGGGGAPAAPPRSGPAAARRRAARRSCPPRCTRSSSRRRV